MTFKRLLTAAAVLAFLVVVGPAAADDLGDGVGAVAPTAVPSETPSVATSEPAPVAEPAQTPTTPEGEEQDPDEQDGDEQPPSQDDDVADLPTDGAGTGGESTGSLPRTGMGLVALTMIGFGLLLAGGALWPTSSWPPPRDRLSRSTLRR